MRSFACSLAAWLAAVGATDSAWGYSPESPEVRRMVAAGVRFLEELYVDTGELDGRLGGKAVVGLALLKAGRYQHEMLDVAAEACREMGSRRPEQITTRDCDIYSTGLAIIFLCELDPVRFREPIANLAASLELRQKDHGGWGYADRDTGDTSMTQYGALSMWTARQSGLPIPSAVFQRYAAWLLATQDPSGGWGYQGEIAPPGQLIKQFDVTVSLTSAALGSLLIYGDAEGVRIGGVGARPHDLPVVVRRVDENADRDRQARGRAAVAVREGDRWLGESFRYDDLQYTYYYMYALERYQSFRELNTGRAAWSRNWYDEGVRFLASKQQADGAWERDTIPEDINTAFAILFLTRSTKRTLERVKNFGDGALHGGRGLPSDTTDAVVVRGALIARDLAGPGDELLGMLSDPDNPDLDYLAEHLDAVEPQLSGRYSDEQLERLREYVGADAPEVRLIALRALARRRNLDDAPRLIYALTDPDQRIVREANSALRSVFRIVDGYQTPAPGDRAGLQSLIDDWSDLYLSIRPDAEPIDAAAR